MSKFPVEEIPDNGMLYRRIHKNILSDTQASGYSPNELPPAVFSYKKGEDMSVHWCKYTTAQAVRNRAKSCPNDNGVVEFEAGLVRDGGHTVVHSPSPNNRAHSSIRGNQPDIRVTLSRIARWKMKI